MRICAFSDIHSNSVAFRAVIKEAEKIGFDACVLLGDYVSDCAYPERTMELIAGLRDRCPCEIIIGNREEYLLNHLNNPNDDWRYNSRTGSLLYTFENLSKDTLRLFQSLPISKTVCFDSCPPFEICHGSFTKSRATVVCGHRDTEEMFSGMKTSLAVVGHTHRMFIMHKGDRILANGGPVGVPGCNLPGAGFLMIEVNKNSFSPSLHLIQYDIDTVIREMDESGLTQKANVWARGIKAMLKTGREYLLEVLSSVKELSRETGCSIDDERLWEEAARRLGI